MAPDPSADRRRRILGAACLVAAPLVLLVSTVLRVADRPFGWTTVVVVWALLAFGAVLAIVGLLRERADRLGLAGGILCFIGLNAVSGMMAFYRLRAALEAYPEAAAGFRAAYEATPLLFATIFPAGLCFPTGLLVLAIGLHRARVLPPALVGALALGAILFPVGRIAGIAPALVASDLLIATVMLYLARRVLTRPEAQPATSPTSAALPVAG